MHVPYVQSFVFGSCCYSMTEYSVVTCIVAVGTSVLVWVWMLHCKAVISSGKPTVVDATLVVAWRETETVLLYWFCITSRVGGVHIAVTQWWGVTGNDCSLGRSVGRGGVWGWKVGRPPQAPLLRGPHASGLWVCQAIFSGKLEMLIHAPFKILQGQIP